MLSPYWAHNGGSSKAAPYFAIMKHAGKEPHQDAAVLCVCARTNLLSIQILPPTSTPPPTEPRNCHHCGSDYCVVGHHHLQQHCRLAVAMVVLVHSAHPATMCGPPIKLLVRMPARPRHTTTTGPMAQYIPTRPTHPPLTRCHTTTSLPPLAIIVCATVHHHRNLLLERTHKITIFMKI